MAQRVLDEKKICFIIAVNDEEKFASCVDWIKKLKVPRGMKLSIQAMRGFSSMTNAYQAAMEKSDAKYKIYIHQDVQCVYKNLLKSLVETFKTNLDFGMLGLIGAREMTPDATWWNTTTDGIIGTVADTHSGEMEIYKFPVEGSCEAVVALDGLFLATQYDVDWRTDLFTGWDFYDISQCVEFSRAGYKVGVVNQEEIWCYHLCVSSGEKNQERFFQSREKFYREYWWGTNIPSIAAIGAMRKFTDIIIVNSDKLNFLKACLFSVKMFTEKEMYRIIVVDNASTDGSVEYLKEQSDIKCIFNNKLINMSEAYRQGLELSSGEEIMFLACDTVVTPRWLNQLRYALYSDNKIGAVGCVTNTTPESLLPSVATYANYPEFYAFADCYNKRDNNKWILVNGLNDACILMKREYINDLTEIDKDDFIKKVDDGKVFSLPETQNEYKFVLCKDTFIHQTPKQ